MAVTMILGYADLSSLIWGTVAGFVDKLCPSRLQRISDSRFCYEVGLDGGSIHLCAPCVMFYVLLSSKLC